MGLGEVLGESTSCFRLAQEVSRRQKGLLTPGELRPWPSRQARPGPGRAGSQPRGQDSRGEALSCGIGRQGGASGGWGAESRACFFPGRALRSQRSQGREGPAGVIRLEGEAVSLSAQACSPPARTPSLPSQSLASFLSLLTSPLAGGACPDLLG